MNEREALSVKQRSCVEDTLKLALEALENHSGNYKLTKEECVKYRAVENSIKEALMSFQDGAHPAVPQPSRSDMGHEHSAPHGEPEAWRNAALRVGEDLCSVGPFGYYDMTAQQWLGWALSVVTVHAPSPQRQCNVKPLTEDKIDDIWNRHCDEMGYVSIDDAIQIARDFEAAHGIYAPAELKEKNT